MSPSPSSQDDRADATPGGQLSGCLVWGGVMGATASVLVLLLVALLSGWRP